MDIQKVKNTAAEYATLAADNITDAAEWSYNHSEWIEGAIVVLTLLALVLIVKKYNQHLRRIFYIKRGVAMERKERIAYVKDTASSLICNALEEAEYDGKLTRNEVQYLYRQLGHTMKINSLKPRQLPLDEQLTDDERKLIIDKRLKAKVKIPGPKPGEDMIFAKAKNFLNKLRSKTAQASS